MSYSNDSDIVARDLAAAYNERMRERGTVSVASENAAETMIGGRVFTVWLDGREYMVNVFPAAAAIHLRATAGGLNDGV